VKDSFLFLHWILVVCFVGALDRHHNANFTNQSAHYVALWITIKHGQLFLQKIHFVVMDTRFLETFVTVVENGSIAEAARRLNLTSAAVAQRIRALESEIGAHLVFRSGRTVRPTESGMAILGRARSFLSEARDLKSIAATDTPAGELRVGAVHTALTGLLPDILRLMTEKYPRIEIFITRAGSADLYSKVLDGDLDVAIVARPPFAIPKTCDWRVFRNEPLIVLTPLSVKIRNPHKILASEPFIRQDRNSWAGRLIDGYLRHAGIRPNERFELDGYESIVVMVDRGLGVSLVHEWAPPWPESLSLAKIPVPANPFGRQVGALWMRATVRIRLVHTFLEEANTALALRNRDVVSKRQRGGFVTRR
jgi:DNA-binding transcriptional LysR family regulator